MHCSNTVGDSLLSYVSDLERCQLADPAQQSRVARMPLRKRNKASWVIRSLRCMSIF